MFARLGNASLAGAQGFIRRGLRGFGLGQLVSRRLTARFGLAYNISKLCAPLGQRIRNGGEFFLLGKVLTAAAFQRRHLASRGFGAFLP